MKRHEAMDFEAMPRQKEEAAQKWREDQAVKEARDESLRQEGRQQAWAMALWIAAIFVWRSGPGFYPWLAILIGFAGCAVAAWPVRTR